MLSDIEAKLTALVADGLAARQHLQVLEAPGPVPALEPDQGAVLVSLAELAPETVFERGMFFQTGTQESPRSQRFLPVQFTARLQFFRRPAAATPEGLSVARASILEDMSLTAHNLGEEAVLNGKAFSIAAPDPGFRVLSFQLDRGVIAPELTQTSLSAELRYRGRAEIWPPGVSREEGEIRVIDRIIAPLPLQISVDDPAVPAGGTTRIRVRGATGRRLVNAGTGQRELLRLAVLVVSDLPPAQRGSITAGDPGLEAGLRILPATEPETVIPYQAPAGNLGAIQAEYIAVHLATPEGNRGLFLGSAMVRLLPEEP